MAAERARRAALAILIELMLFRASSWLLLRRALVNHQAVSSTSTLKLRQVPSPKLPSQSWM